MKRIVADDQPAEVKEFLLSLEIDAGGSIIECDGRLLQVKQIGQQGQDDLNAIKAGYDDVQAGRTMSIEESKRRTEQSLSRYKK